MDDFFDDRRSIFMMIRHIICAHDNEGIFMTIQSSSSPIRCQCLCSLYPEKKMFGLISLNSGRRALNSK